MLRAEIVHLPSLPGLFLFSSIHNLAMATARKLVGFQNQNSFSVHQGCKKKKKKISRCCRSGCQVISAGGVRLIFSFICCTLPRFHQRKWPLCHRAKISKLVLLLQQILIPATWGTWGWEAGGHRRRPSSVAGERRGRGRAS